MNAASHRAIAGNNAAASQIEAGQYPAAVLELSEAVRAFKYLLSETVEGAERTSHSMIIDDCMQGTSMLTDSNAAETQYLYHYPIRIPSHDDMDEDSEINAFGSNYRECSLISCMMVFNLALAHHLDVQNEESEHEVMMDERTYASLRKAQQLYEIAMNMHCALQARAVANGGSSSDVMFGLAIFNNLGLVYQQLHNNEASGKCFQNVLSTLMCLTDAGQGHRFSSKLDGFFVNVTPLISKTKAARAA